MKLLPPAFNRALSALGLNGHEPTQAVGLGYCMPRLLALYNKFLKQTKEIH